VPGVEGAFKLANITTYLGVVDQDRLSGIRGDLGAVVHTIPITSDFTDIDSGASRIGRTDVTDSGYVAGIVPSHVLASFDSVLDHFGPGTSTLRWTIQGHAAGHAFTLDRGDRYASSSDIAFDSFEGIFEDVIQLVFNPFEDVTFDSIDITARISESFRPYLLQKVKVSKNGGPFLERQGLHVQPGDALDVRAVLQRYHSDVSTVDQHLVVPTGVTGHGALVVGLDQDTPIEPSDFHELLVGLRTQPRHDDLPVSLDMFESPPASAVTRVHTRLDSVVDGRIDIPVVAP
jgi:hypothetical protein